jgi:hypothetical protein
MPAPNHQPRKKEILQQSVLSFLQVKGKKISQRRME